MKNKISMIITTIGLLAILLTSCTGATSTATSWGGASITDTAVYYADGIEVYALKIENGNTIWKYPADKGNINRVFLAAPVVVGDQLIVADYGMLLTSLNLRDGLENWQFAEAKGKYIDSVLVVGDIIVAPNADNTIYALDLNGRKLWSFTAENPFWAQPVSDSETVFTASMDHFLYALDLSTGKLKWKTDLKSSVVARPTLVDGVIYVGNLEGVVFAVDSTRGTILWEQKAAGGIWAAPTLAQEKLFVGDQTGAINILNAANGSIDQTVTTDSSILGAGVVLEEGIIFGNEKGELILIGFDGARKWTRSVDGSIYSNLVFNGNTFAVIANKGEKPLIAMDTNANEIWYFTTK